MLTPEESVHYYELFRDGYNVATMRVDGAAFCGAVLYGDTSKGPPPRLVITLGSHAEDGKLHRVRLLIMFHADKRIGE